MNHSMMRESQNSPLLTFAITDWDTHPLVLCGIEPSSGPWSLGDPGCLPASSFVVFQIADLSH